MKVVLFCLLLVSSFLPAYCQEPASTDTTTGAVLGDSVISSLDNSDYDEEASPVFISPDSMAKSNAYSKEDIKITKFDKAKWDKQVKGISYDEAEIKVAKPRRIPNFFGGPWVKIVAYVLISGLIIFMIYYLLSSMSWSGGLSRRKMTAEDFAKPVEDIKDLDFDTLLQESLATGNYRLAVRIYYLGLLKKLNEGGWILWKKDKTNRDYLSELFAKAYHFEEIKSLTLSYENVWYGEHTPSPELFQRIRHKFEAIQSELNASVK